MKSFLAVCLVVFSVLVSGMWCFAEEGHVCFTVVDADKDSKVTIKEYEKRFSKDNEKFNEYDKDGNGVLTHDEYHVAIGGGAS